MGMVSRYWTRLRWGLIPLSAAALTIGCCSTLAALSRPIKPHHPR